MHKVVTTKDERGELRTARVMVSVANNPHLNAAIYVAVMAALGKYRGPRGEEVVHTRDARNRIADAAPPGSDADGGGAAAQLEDQTEPDDGDDQEQSV